VLAVVMLLLLLMSLFSAASGEAAIAYGERGGERAGAAAGVGQVRPARDAALRQDVRTTTPATALPCMQHYAMPSYDKT
jgi:hypothetical protein